MEDLIRTCYIIRKGFEKAPAEKLALDEILDRVFRKSDLSNTTKYRYGLKLSNAVIDKTKALHDELDNCIKEKKKTNRWNYIS